MAWALATYDISAVGGALAGANYWWILPAAVIEVALIFVRAVRWLYFLDPLKKVSLFNAMATTFIGFTANMIFPARAGEFIRPALLAKKESLKTSAVLGTVVIERAVDGITAGFVAVGVLLLVEVPAEKAAYWSTLQAAGLTFIAIFLVLFGAMVMLQKKFRPVEAVIDATLGVLPARAARRARELIDSFLEGFLFLESGHHIFAITLWSVAFWLIAGGLNIAFFYAFGLDLPWIATYLVLMAQVIGVMVPAPGFVGPYHAATVAALSFYGVPAELALSIAIVMHGTMFITNLLPGLLVIPFSRGYGAREAFHVPDER